MQERTIRRSKQRDCIYEYLTETTAHPSAEMVYESLKPQMPALSLGTVYRNLKLLEDLGKIQRVTTHKNMERYDARMDDHAHFVCNHCGKVFDLDRIHRGQIQKACGLSNDMMVSHMKVTFEGTCSACAKEDISA